MQKRKRNRLIFLLLSLTSIATGVTFILYNLSSNIMFFLTPTEVLTNYKRTDNEIRIGGLIKPKSIKHIPNSTSIEFVLTDCKKEIKVIYNGILPTLFREKQGIIARGKIDNNYILNTKELLTKHDENYTPPEMEDTINRGFCLDN